MARDFHVHVQSAPSTVWTVDHGLGRHPSVVVEDDGGMVVWATIQHLSNDTLLVVAAVPFSGMATCS